MLAVHLHMVFCTEYPPPPIYLFQFSLLSPDVKVTSLVHWHSSIALIPPPTWKYSATLLSTRSSYNKQYKNITQHGDYLDNNNCAPSFLRSLCEIGGDCFGPRYAPEEKYRGPKQSPTNSHNDWNKDGAKLLFSLITTTLTNLCVLCVFFLTKTRRKKHFLSFLYTSLWTNFDQSRRDDHCAMW